MEIIFFYPEGKHIVDGWWRCNSHESRENGSSALVLATNELWRLLYFDCETVVGKSCYHVKHLIDVVEFYNRNGFVGQSGTDEYLMQI